LALGHRQKIIQEGEPMKIPSLQTDIVLLPNDDPLAGSSENPERQEPELSC
jgi:hypothetical protein